jgi:hypothetical protein
MSFGFLVINVCNHGEHYDTPCTSACVCVCPSGNDGLKVEGKVALHAMRAYGGVEVEGKGLTDIHFRSTHRLFIVFF